VRDALPDAGRRPLIVGLGNAARGDDAAGLLVARAAGGIELEGDPSALIDLLDGAPEAIVIDAVRSGAAPGTVRRFDVGATALPAVRGSTSTHLVGLAEAIELARALGRLPPRVIVYGIEGERFDTGAPVSAAVAAAISRVADELSGWAERSRPTDGPAPIAEPPDARDRR
jgi:hydrogenase maturation protease